MNKNYLLKLLKQFHEADGTKEFTEIDEGFLQWLDIYQKVLLELKEYYYSLGLEIDDWYAFEFGKGLLDSIILDKDKCISLFNENKSELFISNFIPFQISEHGIRRIDGSNLVYTYNPYMNQDIEKIKRLYQLGIPIAISVVGKTYDKDKSKKILLIERQFEDLNTRSSYEESNDSYFYTFFTPRKTKVKELIRQ